MNLSCSISSSWVSRLLVYPTDFGFANLHGPLSQSLKINPSPAMYTCTHILSVLFLSRTLTDTTPCHTDQLSWLLIGNFYKAAVCLTTREGNSPLETSCQEPGLKLGFPMCFARIQNPKVCPKPPDGLVSPVTQSVLESAALLGLGHCGGSSLGPSWALSQVMPTAWGL